MVANATVASYCRRLYPNLTVVRPFSRRQVVPPPIRLFLFEAWVMTLLVKLSEAVLFGLDCSYGECERCWGVRNEGLLGGWPCFRAICPGTQRTCIRVNAQCPHLRASRACGGALWPAFNAEASASSREDHADGGTSPCFSTSRKFRSQRLMYDVRSSPKHYAFSWNTPVKRKGLRLRNQWRRYLAESLETNDQPNWK